MNPDLREKLSAGLGENYRVERELGGGGMSRVFVAHDQALGRDIVVKVLSPEIAGEISADRFRREIMFAATFQHPCIVPVLTAGNLDGLPFFTMPFVEGESLRARLSRGGALPIAAVQKIVRDIASALAYAHARGVVHRDIKPDNVLLSGGYAVVTDFGIAKAVASARLGDAATTLTHVGTSVGTPAYMSPEQAAGDPATDQRADLYALGCVAYEMLTGRPPFTERVPHKVLAAHMSEKPVNVEKLAPDTPPALALLVMRLLAKDPAERPQNATEVIEVIERITTPSGGSHLTLPAISLATRRTLARALAIYVVSFFFVIALTRIAITRIGLPDWVFPAAMVLMALGLPAILFTAFVYHGSRVAKTMAGIAPGTSVIGSSTMQQIAVRVRPHMSWRRTTWGTISAVGLLALFVSGYMATRALGIGPAASLLSSGRIAEHERLLVADFNASGADSSLGSVVAEAVRSGLSQSPTVSILPTSAVSAALQRMQRPVGSRLDLPLAKDVAEREGIKAIVHGDITSIGSGYIVTLRLIETTSGNELASFHEAADRASGVIPAIGEATHHLREKLGESLKSIHQSPPLSQVTTASLPALRKYTEGMRANYIETDYVKAAAAFEDAIKLDSNFAMAYRMAGTAYGNSGRDPAKRDWFRQRAYVLREHLPPVERLMIEVTALPGFDRQAADPRDVMNLMNRILELDPRNTLAMNLAGVNLDVIRQYSQAESFFRRAIAVADGNAQPQVNILTSLLNQGKIAEAKRQLAIVRQQYPRAYSTALSFEATVPYLEGNFDSAELVLRRAIARYHDRSSDDNVGRLADLVLLRGRVSDANNLLLDWQKRAAARRALVTRLRPPLDSLANDIWFTPDTARQSARLDHLLERMPVAELSDGEDWEWLGVASLWARLGRPDKAREALSRWKTELRDSVKLRSLVDQMRGAEGEIALSEGKYSDAIAKYRAARTNYYGQPSSCAVCWLPEIAEAFARWGMADSAIAVGETYLSMPATRMGSGVDCYDMALTHRRLGELYEKRGDRNQAARHYEAFVQLWNNADPVLQPQVADIRRRLAKLRT